MRTDRTDVQKRVVGVMRGLAAGDRIGGPVRMARLLGASVLARRGLDLHDVAQRYLHWWRNGAFDTGATAARVLALADSGLDFEAAAVRVHESTQERTAGCNPTHRCGPLAMCIDIADADLAAAAQAEARLTHRHPLAGDAAAAVAVLCRALIRGEPWSIAVRRAASDRLPQTRSALLGREELARGGYAPEALRAAVHFVATSADLSDALTRALAFAGPANYCPVLVGSIGGARWGSAAVSEAALAHHGDLVPSIQALASDLAATWSRP